VKTSLVCLCSLREFSIASLDYDYAGFM